jgi:hypothetical protein
MGAVNIPQKAILDIYAEEDAKTLAEIGAVSKLLSETANDPDLIMCCWSFTYCFKCKDENGHIVHISDCKCPDNPFYLPEKEQQEWLRNH